MTLPNQHHYHCNEYEAEQLLQGLIDDGMIIEFEPGKYKPTEKLSESEVFKGNNSVNHNKVLQTRFPLHLFHRETPMNQR